MEILKISDQSLCSGVQGRVAACVHVRLNPFTRAQHWPVAERADKLSTELRLLALEPAGDLKGPSQMIKHKQPPDVTRHKLTDEVPCPRYEIRRVSGGEVTVIGYTERSGNDWLIRRAGSMDSVLSRGAAPHTKGLYWLSGDPAVTVDDGMLIGTPEGFESAPLGSYPPDDLQRAAQDAAERELENTSSGSKIGGGGQGFQVDAKLKTAIDSHAMEAAKVHYASLGWNVVDVHIGNEFDLACHRDGEIRHVEVKGTTTDGRAIIITRNERLHAEKCTKPEPCHVTELFILRKIKIKTSHDGVQVPEKGEKQIYDPWVLNPDGLTSINYRYQLPDELV